ncbi:MULTISPECIES: aldehyde dehydrogenase family protein [Micromonospora]|uniref:aldehyde dehydrogenase (NAD(+)) n=1 Tax=Micromonospora yangpuensis TaxID=683228 RepID=A0A1C6UVS0_9ACTN|nr:aldehyde dehydrogenase family protein [Micromonospora yangpuensis]GGM25799.1 aldehyde dehydrogenase [Micromonospora yangpuensis]SCL58137.1 Acyl-CoA reductase [Micromonospora yangpuensis]
MTNHSRRYHWIDGKPYTPSGGETIDLINPSTEQLLGQVPAGTAADVDRAVAVAVGAFADWSTTSPQQRAEILARAAEGMQRQGKELAEVITAEVGAPAKISLSAQVGFPLNVLRSHVDILRDFAWSETIANSLVLKEPVGVVGAISPWNFPIQLVMAKLAPALAAGCTVVLKPSEYTPLTAYLLAEIFQEAGLPDGVFNIVCGTGPVVGEAISRHPLVNMVSMTGSTRAGRQVFAAASTTVKRMHLELGGKSASLVLPDADFDKAVRTTIDQAFFNSGQACLAWSRMLVPQERMAEAAEIAASQAALYRSGDPTSSETDLGPQQNKACFDRVQEYIGEAMASDATLVAGGPGRPDGIDRGWFVRPTVFADVRPGDRIAQEEVFGPVMSIIGYRDPQEGVAIANDSIFGLHGAVWAGDEQAAMPYVRQLRTGRIDVNGAKTNLVSPFGGYKQSGFGRELGIYGFESYLEIKSVQLAGDDTGGLEAGIRVREAQG